MVRGAGLIIFGGYWLASVRLLLFYHVAKFAIEDWYGVRQWRHTVDKFLGATHGARGKVAGALVPELELHLSFAHITEDSRCAYRYIWWFFRWWFIDRLELSGVHVRCT